VTAGSAPAFSATFGSSNRMVSYSYDNNGNQLNTADGATLEYDWENRLTKWTKQGQTEEYRYDPSGWRMQKEGPSWATYFYGPGGQLLSALDGSVGYTDYVYFGGRLLFTLNQGSMGPGYTKVTRIYGDRLGSTRGTYTTDPYYQSSWTTRNYYPFGEEITSTANNQYKYASTYRDAVWDGSQWVATGLDYAVNRYYASGTGRFLTTDPKSGSAKAERPQSWNRYAYAGNNPVNSIDPRGLNQDECQIPTTGDLIPDCLSGGGGSNGPCFIDPFYPVPDPYCPVIISIVVSPKPKPQWPKCGEVVSIPTGMNDVVAMLLGENSWGMSSPASVFEENMAMVSVLENRMAGGYQAGSTLSQTAARASTNMAEGQRRLTNYLQMPLNSSECLAIIAAIGAINTVLELGPTLPAGYLWWRAVYARGRPPRPQGPGDIRIAGTDFTNYDPNLGPP